MKLKLSRAPLNLKRKMSRNDHNGDVVMNGVDDYFDPEIVARLDHSARMRRVEEEEVKRKSLIKRLAQLEEETKNIEVSCLQSTNSLNQVKPYIKQLLDRVGPTLQQQP